ncbi:hypothetical protein WA026_021875 [Henosepilachna vigintioctopunctata]|uniref:FAM69 protein-kinase domain-containing protein n=1 Tax=Henosepilachna vigintioctopunctata TaxID=420089 RepID=A0AAW1UPR8_9CUCU
MMTFRYYPALFCALAIAIIYIVSLFSSISLIKICDVKKCPLCYGTDLCKTINSSEISLDFSSFEKLFNNFFSVKNVFYANYKDSGVVLKKLGQDEELAKVLTIVKTLSTSKYREFLSHSVIDSFYRKDGISVKNFHVCDLEVAEYLLEYFYEMGISLEQIWTINQVNVEPLLLQIFRHENNWPVPKYYGACGLIIMESHCGYNLNSFEGHSWTDRATIAINIINAAEDFTKTHELFSLYLTDISPDNIVVNEDLNVCFVDLENGILQMRDNETLFQNIEHLHHHRSKNFAEESYIYSPDDICTYALSDHNIYSICKLILSSKSPWPMMKGGLLHSPPQGVQDHDLFQYIELCVDADEKINRFAVIRVIVNILKELLNIKSG